MYKAWLPLTRRPLTFDHYFGGPYTKRELVCVSALAVVERWHSFGDPANRGS